MRAWQIQSVVFGSKKNFGADDYFFHELALEIGVLDPSMLPNVLGVDTVRRWLVFYMLRDERTRERMQAVEDSAADNTEMMTPEVAFKQLQWESRSTPAAPKRKLGE